MTALVIGATGLVGSVLVNQLLSDDRFNKLLVFARRSTGIQHAKLTEHIIDFDTPQNWKMLVQGDVLFSSLGTTLKQAGSKGAQFKVDYIYQYQFAKAASENGVKKYVLISAASSSPNSKIFYSRMKGILEKDIKNLSFEHITILRPGLLTGNRKEERFGEKLGAPILNFLHYLPGLNFLKPIAASVVAKAMINASFHHRDHINEYTLAEVFKLASLNEK